MKVSMKTIYVGNLSFDVTEDEVRLLVEEHGPVENVKIITDRNTGRSKGFALLFVFPSWNVLLFFMWLVYGSVVPRPL